MCTTVACSLFFPESYAAHVPLLFLIHSFYFLFVCVWSSTDQLRLQSGSHHHSIFVCFLGHKCHSSVQFIFDSKFVVYQLLLVKGVCDLTEHLLFQFYGLLCHCVELHLLFAWELMRSRERFLTWISTAISTIANITTSWFLWIVFIFLWKYRLANLSLLLLTTGTGRVVVRLRCLLFFWLFFL